MTFASRLRTLREAASLTIPQLAERASMPRQTLHLLENGQRQPSLETAERLAAALGKKLRVFEGCGVDSVDVSSVGGVSMSGRTQAKARKNERRKP